MRLRSSNRGNEIEGAECPILVTAICHIDRIIVLGHLSAKLIILLFCCIRRFSEWRFLVKYREESSMIVSTKKAWAHLLSETNHKCWDNICRLKPNQKYRHNQILEWRDPTVNNLLFLKIVHKINPEPCC